MKTELINKATNLAGRLTLLLRKNSPVILTGVGVVGVVATAVAASKATLKADPVLDETIEYKEAIRDNDSLSEKERAKDYLYLYGRTAGKLGKIYLPSILIGVTTIGCVIGGHKVLHTRNVALAASYTALNEAFEKYRERAVELFGEEADSEIKNAVGRVKKKTNDEGEEEEEPRKDSSVNEGHPYSKLFDEVNPNWTKNPESNLFFLKSVERYANDRLERYGHVFLNEVLDDLGMERTKAGALTGWVRNNAYGDGCVDFGLYRNTPSTKALLAGEEASVWLEFNVDGLIYHLLDE